MSDIVIYQADDGHPGLQVQLDQETAWLTQKQMAELFDKDIRTVNEHLKNIFKEGELAEDSVVWKFRITAADGKSYNVGSCDDSYKMATVRSRKKAVTAYPCMS